MTRTLARAIMALATCCLDDGRRDWAAAMRFEFEEAETDGHPLSFALGCLMAAARELLTRQEGRFTLTSYALALGVMLPMAALQFGCALFGLPYLFPGSGGLPTALLEGRVHEGLIRGVYQAAVPSLALLLFLLGLAHVRIAWAMLERDWGGVRRLGMQALAATVTLILFMAALFLNGRQALLQGGVLTIELATVALVARWHADLFAAPAAERPG